MPDYRCKRVPSGAFFFTANLLDRRWRATGVGAKRRNALRFSPYVDVLPQTPDNRRRAEKRSAFRHAPEACNAASMVELFGSKADLIG